MSRSIQIDEPRPSGRGFLLTDPALLVGLGLLFAWLALGAAPSVFWEDSGNLVASAWLLGVPHSPGEPGWLVPARLFMWLPVGDLAFRANLFSAACVAAIALPLWWMLKACVPRPGAAAGLFVVLAGLVGYGARLQAVRAEVYGTTALLLVLSLAGAVALTGRRATAVSAGALGLAATVHPLLAVAAVPGIAAARWARSPIRPADVGIGLLLGLAPSGLYAALPVRATAIPWRSWGVPDNLQAFLDVLLARNFVQNFGGQSADLATNLATLFGLYRRAGLVLLVLLALFAWSRRAAKPVRALAIAAPLWIAGNLATQATQNVLYGDNPDVSGYMLPGWLILVPLAAVGVHAAWSPDVREALRLPSRLTATGLAVVLLGLQLFDGRDADRRDDHLPARFASTMSYGLPGGAVLMTSGNSAAFLWTYLDGVERRARGVLTVHRALLGHPQDRLRLDRETGGFPEATGLPWHLELRDRPLNFVAGARRPFFLELREIDLPDARAGRRHGLVTAFGAEPAPGVARVAGATLAELEARPAVDDPTAALVAAHHREIEALLPEGAR